MRYLGYFEAIEKLAAEGFTSREVSNLIFAASDMSQSFHGVRVTCHRDAESFRCTYEITWE